MRNIFKKSLVFFCLLICLSCLNVKAYEDYTIDKYDIDIKVNEDNTFDIKETIDANFNIPKHGIFRTIPLKNEVIREDGSSYKNKAKITNVKVNEEFSTSRENGNYVIKIGSADRTLTGLKEYEINYHYNIGNDKSKEFDELYYNLIGTNWDTTISNITFRISMPKEFDQSKLGFSAGNYGSGGTSDVSYQVDGNVITGTFNDEIAPGEALTVRLELPNGYFVEQKVNVFEYLIYILPIAFLGISILLWYLYGRDDQVVETIEFYPPEGKNSLEVGFLYKGKAEQEDVTSLLIYLANKGYIKIQEEGKKGFKITKVKDYDGNNYEEKEFLDGLFKNSSKTKEGIEFVTDDDLYDSFYVTMNSILRSANSSENKNAIFEKSASNKTFIIILMIIATFCIITIPPFIEDGEMELLMFALLFPGIGFTLMFQFLISDQTIYVNGQATNSKIVIKIFGVVFGLLFGGFPWLFLVFPILSQNIIYLVMYIIGVLCVFGMLVSLKYLPKRTPYGNEVLGKLKGFKTFLETAEKEKLEAMVKDNPTYFYDILPFTYVLGVSSTWISKFETINMEAPTWYYGYDAFDIIRFNRFMDNTMNVAAKSMTSAPSSSSDGGFSGGGFSGGGFSGGGSGGGGGGSW